MLPLFETERNRVNYGSPFRTARKVRGRTAKLDSTDLLGLVLWFLKGKECMYRLCPIFGVVPSTLSTWLNYSLEVLLRVVHNESNTQFAIKWPSLSEMESAAQLLSRSRQNGHLLRGVFAVMDGCRMLCVAYGDPYVQNAYWEG